MGALPGTTPTLQDSGVIRTVQSQGSIANPYGNTETYDNGSGRLINSTENASNPYAKQQAQMGNVYQLSRPQRNSWFNAQRY